MVKNVCPITELDVFCDNEEGRLLLRTIIEPIAQIVRCVCTLQPHTDLIGIGGGVPAGIGEAYKQELMRQLSAESSYADGMRTRSTRIMIVGDHEVSPEIGAQILITEKFQIQK